MIQLAPVVLSSVAMMAGGPATVSCSAEDIGTQTLSVTDMETREITLSDEFCPEINYLVRRGKLPKDLPQSNGWTWERSTETMDGLILLLHEAGHLRHPGNGPGTSEACVQRFAVRHLSAFARRLGLGAALIQRIAHYGPKMTHDWMPAEYQPKWCDVPAPYNPDRRG